MDHALCAILLIMTTEQPAKNGLFSFSQKEG